MTQYFISGIILGVIFLISIVFYLLNHKTTQEDEE